MAGSLSDYAEKKILAHSIGKTSWAMPTTVHIALYTTPPNENTDGVEVPTNVNGSPTGYARCVAYKLNAQSAEIWQDPTNEGTITNAVAFEFGPATSTWGNIEGVAVLDAESGGNKIWYGTFTSPRTVLAGEKLVFGAGSFVLALN